MTPHTPEGTVGRLTRERVEEFRRDLLADPEVETPHGQLVLTIVNMALRPDSSGEAVREACLAVLNNYRLGLCQADMMAQFEIGHDFTPEQRSLYSSIQAMLDECHAAIRNLPLPTLPAAEGCEVDAKLTKPAWVGNGSFGIGVSERLVIDKAQRQYEYEMSPERVAKRAAARKKFIEEVNAAVVFAAPEPMSVWSKSQRPVSKSEEAGIDAALPAPPAAGEV